MALQVAGREAAEEQVMAACDLAMRAWQGVEHSLVCGWLRRAFMWGAKAGQEQLPPFPEPSHFAAFQGGVPQSARNCIVGFTSEESRDAARQMVRPCSFQVAGARFSLSFPPLARKHRWHEGVGCVLMHASQASLTSTWVCPLHDVVWPQHN